MVSEVGRAFRVIEGGQELLQGNYVVNFRFIRKLFLYTVFTQMYMTNTTVHRGHGIPTQGTPHNILGTMLGVKGKGTLPSSSRVFVWDRVWVGLLLFSIIHEI